MQKSYTACCDCGQIAISMTGAPKVHAVCHCGDCRALYDIPFYALTAWEETQVSITRGEESVIEFDYASKDPGKDPAIDMKRFFCGICGTTLFNTNVYGWRVVPQLLIAQHNEGVIPEELASDKHIFYESRVVSINDSLPKYLRGLDGPLYDEQ